MKMKHPKKNNPRRCPDCKNDDLLADETHKEIYCSKCGLILKGTQRYSGGHTRIIYPFGHF